MAKGQYLSDHQKSIVNRYYAQLDTLTITKLQEAVSDLYLIPSGPDGVKASQRRWKSVRAALAKAGVEAAKADQIVSSQDVQALAAVVATLSGRK